MRPIAIVTLAVIALATGAQALTPLQVQTNLDNFGHNNLLFGTNLTLHVQGGPTNAWDPVTHTLTISTNGASGGIDTNAVLALIAAATNSVAGQPTNWFTGIDWSDFGPTNISIGTNQYPAVGRSFTIPEIAGPPGPQGEPGTNVVIGLEDLSNRVTVVEGYTNRAAGAVQRAGDTMTGALLTIRDQVTTTPPNAELVNAGWVRSLASIGAEWYFTQTVTNGFGEKTANFVALAAEPPAALFTNSIASPVASDTYLAGGVSTNIYTSLQSPVTFEIYMNRVGGNASTVIPVHPEVYYVYDGTTNHLGDWEVANQTVTATTPTKYTFVVPFTTPVITGAVHLIGYLKSGTVSGTAAGLRIYGGGLYASHLDIEGAGASSADIVAADLAAHTNETTTAHGGIVADDDPALTNSRPPTAHTQLRATITDLSDQTWPGGAITSEIPAAMLSAAVTNAEPASITTAMLQDRSVTGGKLGTTNTATSGYVLKATVVGGVTNLYYGADATGAGGGLTNNQTGVTLGFDAFSVGGTSATNIDTSYSAGDSNAVILASTAWARQAAQESWNKAYASVYLSSDQTATNGTSTRILFNAESIDNQNCHSAGVFTCPRAGNYLIMAAAGLESLPDQKQLTLQATAAGTLVGGFTGYASQSGSSGAAPGAVVMGIMPCAAGAAIVVNGINGDTSNRNFGNNKCVLIVMEL